MVLLSAKPVCPLHPQTTELVLLLRSHQQHSPTLKMCRPEVLSVLGSQRQSQDSSQERRIRSGLFSGTLGFSQLHQMGMGVREGEPALPKMSRSPGLLLGQNNGQFQA